jgi:hypothetical protein
MSVSVGSVLVVGQLLLLLAYPGAGPRGAVRVGCGMDEERCMAGTAVVGTGGRSWVVLEGGVVLLFQLWLLTHAADAALAVGRALFSGRGGWEMISQRGLAAACAAATALAPAVARPGATERRRPYRDDTLLLLLLLLPTLLEAARAVGDAYAGAEGILLLLGPAKLWPCFICLYCRAAVTARLPLLLTLAEGCGPACTPTMSKG